MTDAFNDTTSSVTPARDPRFIASLIGAALRVSAIVNGYTHLSENHYRRYALSTSAPSDSFRYAGTIFVGDRNQFLVDEKLVVKIRTFSIRLI
jgi:6-phosphofructokinase